ncbi:MAG: ankyrin repeat domain-containing protein, partial [Rhodospirillaceae bacterium]|nr:ankyrin repeat domain-containing protein [Rhodospirillaceae bacterium]
MMLATRWITAALMLVSWGTTSHIAAAGELAEAAMRGDTTTVSLLLDQGTDVDEPQPDGATALHWAVYGNHAELARLLIDAGAEVAVRNRAGMTPLVLAAETGSAGMVERLLDAGADPLETLPNGETALMMAARTGDVETIELLIDRGAEIDARETRRGTTALMWAAAYGNQAAVRVLANRGADLGLRSDPIQQARRPYLAPTPKERIDEYLRGTGQAGTAIAVDLGGGDDTAESPARPADGEADQPVISPEGVEAVAADREPVQDATGVSTRTAEVVGDPTQPADVVGDFGGYRRERPITGGLTPLVFAARHGDIATVRVLLDAGADVNQVTEYGWTALLTATQNRYYQLGKYLLERGADPAIGNTGGWTPLYIATDNRNIESGDYPTRQPDMDHMQYIDLLLDHGADPNARMLSSTETRTIFTHQWLREEGATPFWRASQSSDTELMRRLLDAGADPLIATHNGTTALMVASGIGWVEGVTH